MENRLIRTATVTFALVACAALSFLDAANAQPDGTVLASGFNGPMGVLVTPNGDVLVIDTGTGGDTEMPFANFVTYELETANFGLTARIVRVDPAGTQTTVASLPSFVITPTESAGGSRLAQLEGVLYATNGIWLGMEGVADEPPPMFAEVLKIDDGEVSTLTSAWDLESSENPDGGILESNPYGLVAGPDGMLWMTDAAGNTLQKIDPATGMAEVVATFDGVPSPIPNPNRGDAMVTDPVPTGIAFGADGTVYVAFLPGFPLLPGSSKVVTVGDDGNVSDYATGLTMITDLRFGPDGSLYGTSFGEFTEQGPTPNSGALVRIVEGAASNAVVEGLSFPTSVDFNAAGDAYVATNGVGPPGSGQLVVYRGLAAAGD